MAIVVALGPPLFVFFMIQMGAVTFPFWDHWEQARFLITYYDHGLFAAVREVIGALSQHTRPITVRLIFLINGILTDWDIRSEYVYMYIVFACTLIAHYKLIRKLDRQQSSLPGAILFSVISVIYFSPANHNNHWWSWMLQLNLNNLITLLAFMAISFHPRRALYNGIAAALCWLSIYTLTNGLFLILIIASISQLAGERPLKISKLTAFWVINIVMAYWAYFPIQEPGTSAHPNVLHVLYFSLAYLGNPIASLIHFSYQNLFEPHVNVLFSAICGVFLLGFFAILVFLYRKYFRRPTAHFLLLIGFGGFAILSALITGWARVDFDSYGVRNGNSSRYVITSSYLLFGILYFIFTERGRNTQVLYQKISRSTLLLLVGTCYLIFLGISINTYARSVKLYKQATDHNELISKGFSLDGSDTAYDKYLYPNQDQLKKFRSDLLRLSLGPYKYQRIDTFALTDDKLLGTVSLSAGVIFSQQFTVSKGRLKAISFPIVTWGKHPSSYAINFRLSEVTGSGLRLLAERKILAQEYSDWQIIKFSKFAKTEKNGQFIIEISVPENQSVVDPVGLVLSNPINGENSLGNMGIDVKVPREGSLRMSIGYGQY